MTPQEKIKSVKDHLRDFCGWTPIDELLSSYADLIEHADILNMDSQFFTLMIDTYEKSLDTIVRNHYLSIWIGE